MDFKLSSEYSPTGDQPQAIEQLVAGVNDGTPAQVLLGVTGSGKTFTMANVIQQVKRPTLILSHNKTLAAQLYSEFKNFFPGNSVQYFVSYYDYYQPEAYIPSVDKYIEKDLMINDEIDKLRLATTSALLSGRQDVIVVSSVSCLYGIGRLPRKCHNDKGRTENCAQPVPAPACIGTLFPERYRTRTRHIPSQGRHHRHTPGLRRNNPARSLLGR